MVRPTSGSHRRARPLSRAETLVFVSPLAQYRLWWEVFERVCSQRGAHGHVIGSASHDLPDVHRQIGWAERVVPGSPIVSLEPLPSGGRLSRPVALRRRLAALEPDLVLLGPEPHDKQVISALVALETLRAPTVVSLAMENRVRLPGGWRGPAIRGLWQRLDGVAAAAEATAASYRGAGLPAKIRIETLAAAVLPPPVTVTPLDLPVMLPAAEVIVGFVGRLVDEKGVVVLLDAVERCNGVGLVLAGTGPLEEEIARRSRGALRGRVAALGMLTRDDVWRMLAGVDILALPSLTREGWSEQFGLVLGEAMALSVPLIGSSSGAIPEVTGDAGMIVPEGSVESLTEAIRTLAADASLRKRFGENGRRRYELEFTVDACAGRISRLFDSCGRR